MHGVFAYFCGNNPFIFTTMTYEDLKAIISIADVLANLDGDSDQREVTSIVKSVHDAYDISADDLLKLMRESAEMSVEEAMSRIAQLTQEEKNFTSNLFGNVILADKVLTDKEKETYWKLQEYCRLPDFDPESCHMDALQKIVQQDTFPVPVFLTMSFDLSTFGNIKHASVLLWDLGDRPLAALEHIYTAPGKPEPEFYTRLHTEVLDTLSEKMGFAGGEYRLSFIYDKHGGAYNNPVTFLNDGNAMYGTCTVCLSNDKYYMKGFTDKTTVRYLLNALDIISNHTCFVGTYDSSKPVPAASKLLEAQKEYLQDFLNDVENNKIHKP